MGKQVDSIPPETMVRSVVLLAGNIRELQKLGGTRRYPFRRTVCSKTHFTNTKQSHDPSLHHTRTFLHIEDL